MEDFGRMSSPPKAGTGQVPVPGRIVKVGLAHVRENRLLTLRKRGGVHLILPGGKLEPKESDFAALVREIREELRCEPDVESLKWIGEFEDIAADEPGATVVVRLYTGTLIGEPEVSSEIAELRWFDPSGDDPGILAPSIRRQILPALGVEIGPSARWHIDVHSRQDLAR